MYENFFGLQRRPFAAAPDPKCFVPVSTMQSALDALVVNVERGQGVALLTAGPGLGKSLLCRKLADELSQRYRSVVVENGNFPTRSSLLQTVLFELERPYRQMSEQELRLDVLAAARQLHAERRPLLVVIDEAHTLNDEVLDEIRSLTNLVEAGEPLVRFVLCGQLDLEERLARPEYEAFNQRVFCHVTLDPLTQDESADYIRWRLEWAGGRLEDVFTPEAVRAICYASDGVPRCLNHLCDHSLLLGFVAEERPVEAETVKEALGDLKQLPLAWKDPPWLKPALDHVAEWAPLGGHRAPSGGRRADSSARNQGDGEHGGDAQSTADRDRRPSEPAVVESGEEGAVWGGARDGSESSQSRVGTEPGGPSDAAGRTSEPAAAASGQPDEPLQEPDGAGPTEARPLQVHAPAGGSADGSSSAEAPAVVEVGFGGPHDSHAGPFSSEPSAVGARVWSSESPGPGGEPASVVAATVAVAADDRSAEQPAASAIEVGFGVDSPLEPQPPADGNGSASATSPETEGNTSPQPAGADEPARGGVDDTVSGGSSPTSVDASQSEAAEPQEDVPAEAAGASPSAAEPTDGPQARKESEPVPDETNAETGTEVETTEPQFEEIPVVDRYAALDAVAEGADLSGIVWEIGHDASSPDGPSTPTQAATSPAEGVAARSDESVQAAGPPTELGGDETEPARPHGEGTGEGEPSGSERTRGDAAHAAGTAHTPLEADWAEQPEAESGQLEAEARPETASSTDEPPVDEPLLRQGTPRPDLTIDELMPLLRQSVAVDDAPDQSPDDAGEPSAGEAVEAREDSPDQPWTVRVEAGEPSAELEPERSIGEDVLNLCLETRRLLLGDQALQGWSEAASESQTGETAADATGQPATDGRAEVSARDEPKAEGESAPSAGGAGVEREAVRNVEPTPGQGEPTASDGAPGSPSSGGLDLHARGGVEASDGERPAVSSGAAAWSERDPEPDGDDVVRLPEDFGRASSEWSPGGVDGAASGGSSPSSPAGSWRSEAAPAAGRSGRSSAVRARRPYAFLFSELRRRQRLD